MADLELEDIGRDWKRATEGLASWRTETRESYDFVASKQWSETDIARLEEEERPAVTFDRIGVFVDAVCGMEVNNRQVIKYFPVERGDIRFNDMLTNAVRYYENDCGAEDEDSEAVRDTVICGLGVTETVMSYENHVEGAPCVVRRDPLSTWYDPEASRRNLKDARFFFYGDWIPREEAEDRWPEASFSSEIPGELSGLAHVADQAFLYREDAELDSHEGQVFILHYQCWKKEDIYRMTDPETGSMVEISKGKLSAAKELFKQQYGREPVEKRDYLKTTKKVYYRAFVSGAEILEQAKLPVDKFTFNFLTFKRDRNARMWFGLVRAMKDPQRWANKWLSQILHIVNSNAKGGAFAEAGAFLDPRKAEEDWAQASPLILLKEGGIDKIRDRQQANYPSGLDRLMQFAFNALPMVSGLNLEVLGLADRDQAGVLEQQRRQSAFSLLAPLFAAIREYRRSRGRLMLDLMKLIPQSTLVRIVGSAGEQWVPLQFDRNATYDVRIDQAPDSPDYKKEVWAALGQILPPMMKAGYPVPPEVLNYSPLPPEVSEEWIGWIKSQGWMPPEAQEQITAMQQNMEKLGKENMSMREENLQMRVDNTTELIKLKLKQEEGDQRNAIKAYQSQLEAMSSRIQSAFDAQKNNMDALLKAEKIKMEERTKSAQLAANLKVESAKAQIASFKEQVKAFETLLKSREMEADARNKRKLSVKKLKDGEYQISPDE